MRSFVILFLLSAPQDESNAIKPGRLIVDPPTFENLGFRWYVEDDANRDASVTMTFREKGEESWKPALPLLRVRHEVVNRDFGPYRCGNLFAGSILGLRPDRAYEVRLEMKDPDGGAAEPRALEVRTRGVPKRPEGGRTFDVHPGDDFQAVFKKAEPGDTLLFHAGVYKVGRDGWYPRRSGKPGKHIVLRGAGDGEAIFEGADLRTTIVDVRNTSYLWFENLTFRKANNAIRGGSSGLKRSGDGGKAGTGLVVVRCRMRDVLTGIVTYSEYSENYYLADNVITGNNPAWYPRPRQGYMEPSHTGINLYGRGHVVCHNRISKFGDCIAVANFGKPVEDPNLHAVAIDFYNNDLSEAKDDHIEADYGCHNIRVYRNRCVNGHTALSAQPLYGGPVYFVRNEMYAITALAYKLHNWPAGVIIAHNTSVSARQAFQTAPLFQNTRMWNNLVLGSREYTIEAGSPDTLTRLDYNGWRKNEDPSRFIKWRRGKEVSRFKSLEEFREGTGNGRHSFLVDYDIFEKCGAAEEGKTYVSGTIDLRLKEGTRPVDAGRRLPTLNDDFTGDGPDLGCYERGRPLPKYGPRP